MKQWYEFFSSMEDIDGKVLVIPEEGWGFSTMEYQSLMTDDLVENST